VNGFYRTAGFVKGGSKFLKILSPEEVAAHEKDIVLIQRGYGNRAWLIHPVGKEAIYSNDEADVVHPPASGWVRDFSGELPAPAVKSWLPPPTAATVVDRDGATPLHILCKNTTQAPELLSALVSANVHALKIQDNSSMTPMHHLCSRRDIDAGPLSHLIEAISCRSDFLPQKPLPLYLPQHYFRAKFNYDLVFDRKTKKPKKPRKYVYSRGEYSGGFEIVDQEQNTPLHLLLKRADINVSCIVPLLATCPQSASSQDSKGRTPLHCLCMDPKTSDCFSRVTLELLQLFLKTLKAEKIGRAADGGGEDADDPLISELFRLIDRNADGRLTRTEVIKALRTQESVRLLFGLSAPPGAFKRP
jgi:hypothetical protein